MLNKLTSSHPNQEAESSLEAMIHSEELSIQEKDRRNRQSLITSALIGIGVISAILVLLTLCFRYIITDEVEGVSVYMTAQTEESAPPPQKKKKIPIAVEDIPIISTQSSNFVVIPDIIAPQIELSELDLDQIDISDSDFDGDSMDISSFNGQGATIGNGTGMSGGKSGMFRYSKPPKSIIFLVDKSGSMYVKMQNNKTRTELLEIELKKCLSNLASGTPYEIILFDNLANYDAHANFKEIKYKKTDSYTVKNIDFNTHKDMLKISDNIHAVQYALSAKPELLYILTDAFLDLAYFNDIAIQAQAQKTVIRPILFSPHQPYEDIMLSLAQQTKGIITIVDDNGNYTLKE